MYDFPDELDKITEDTLWDILNINMASLTMLTHMIIPQMKKQKKGAIVNISSGSEMQPMPLMAVYAASKRYVKNFTQAMERELQPYNIEVQCVTPLFISTKMNQFSATVMRGGLFIPDAKNYARFAVFTLGKTKMTSGYWSHGIQVSLKCTFNYATNVLMTSLIRLQYFFMKLAPEFVRIRLSHKVTQKLRLEGMTQNKIT